MSSLVFNRTQLCLFIKLYSPDVLKSAYFVTARLCDHTATRSKHRDRRAALYFPWEAIVRCFPLTPFPSLENLPDSGNMEDFFPGSFWSWMPFTEKMDAAEDDRGPMRQHLQTESLTCCSVCTHCLPVFGPDPRGSESTSVWGRPRLTPASWLQTADKQMYREIKMAEVCVCILLDILDPPRWL